MATDISQQPPKLKTIFILLAFIIVGTWPYWSEWVTNPFKVGEPYVGCYNPWYKKHVCNECNNTDWGYDDVCDNCGSTNSRTASVRQLIMYKDVAWLPDLFTEYRIEEIREHEIE